MNFYRILAIFADFLTKYEEKWQKIRKKMAKIHQKSLKIGKNHQKSRQNRKTRLNNVYHSPAKYNASYEREFEQWVDDLNSGLTICLSFIF